MAKKKVAMVQPRPAQPANLVDLDLASVLQELGNNRAYTLLDANKDRWLVHFEGDIKPSMVMYLKDKWVIAQAK